MKTLFTILTILLLCSVFMGGVVESKGANPVYWINPDGLLVPVITDTIVFPLPTGDTLWFPQLLGTNGQLMKVNASGQLYWADDAGSGGGDNVKVDSAGVIIDATDPIFVGRLGVVYKVINDTAYTEISLNSIDSTHIVDSTIRTDKLAWRPNATSLGNEIVVLPATPDSTLQTRKLEGGLAVAFSDASDSIYVDCDEATITNVGGEVKVKDDGIKPNELDDDGRSPASNDIVGIYSATDFQYLDAAGGLAVNAGDSLYVDCDETTISNVTGEIVVQGLSALSGSVTDGQVPNTITIDEAGDLSDTLGTIFRTFVDRQDTTLAGHPIDTITDALADGDVLTWNDVASEWWPEAGSGETNTLVDTGLADGSAGFSLSATKAVSELRIRTVQEGTDIAISYAGTGVNDTAIVIGLTSHAGTDVSADLEEESHASEHQDGGADEIAVTKGMMNTGTNASASTYWRGDDTWATPAGGSGSTDTVGFAFGDTTKYQVDKAIKIKKGFGLDNTPFADSSGMDTTTLSVDTANDITSLERFAKVTDDTTNFKAAHTWGDHSTQNYLDNDNANVDTAHWNAAWSWGDHPAETDPIWTSASGDYAMKTWVQAGAVFDTTSGPDTIFYVFDDGTYVDTLFFGYISAVDGHGKDSIIGIWSSEGELSFNTDTVYFGNSDIVIKDYGGSGQMSFGNGAVLVIGLGSQLMIATDGYLNFTELGEEFLQLTGIGLVADGSDSTLAILIDSLTLQFDNDTVQVDTSFMATINEAKKLIGDSLNEYSLTTDIASTYMRNDGDTTTGAYRLGALDLLKTGASAYGPNLNLIANNDGASAHLGDEAGIVRYRFEDNGGTIRDAGSILGIVVDSIAASYGGRLDFYTSISGSYTKKMSLLGGGNLDLMGHNLTNVAHATADTQAVNRGQMIDSLGPLNLAKDTVADWDNGGLDSTNLGDDAVGTAELADSNAAAQGDIVMVAGGSANQFGFKTTSEIGMMTETDTIDYADSALHVKNENIKVIGDFEVVGNLNKWNLMHWIDTASFTFFPADTYLFAELPSGYYHADSPSYKHYIGVHPSAIAIPNGFRGYKWWYGNTPLYNDAGTILEDPMVWCTNAEPPFDTDSWHCFIDSIGQDTVSAQLRCTVGTVEDSYTYRDTIYIDGTAIGNVNENSGIGATKASITDDMVAAINANGSINSYVTAIDSGDYYVIVSDTAGKTLQIGTDTYLDTLSKVPIYALATNPIQAGLTLGGGYLSDIELDYDDEGRLWTLMRRHISGTTSNCYWKASDTVGPNSPDVVCNPDTNTIYGSYTTDGLNWSNATILLGPYAASGYTSDTTNADSLSKAIGLALLSPASWLHTLGDHRLLTFEGRSCYGPSVNGVTWTTGSGDSVISNYSKSKISILWETTDMATGWDSVGATDMTARPIWKRHYLNTPTSTNEDTLFRDLWHGDVLVTGADELLAFVTTTNKGGSGSSTMLMLYSSYDGGLTWREHQEAVFEPWHDTYGDGDWDSDYPYRGSPVLLESGAGLTIGLFYAAHGSGTSQDWHTGFGVVRFNVDTVSTPAFIDFLTTYGRDVVDDSCELYFERLEGWQPIMWVDSFWSANVADTVTMTGSAYSYMQLDTLIIAYKSNGVKIASLNLVGPVPIGHDRDQSDTYNNLGDVPAAEYARWSDNTDRSSASYGRTAIYLGDSLTCRAGDRWHLRFRDSSTTATNAYLKLVYARIKGHEVPIIAADTLIAKPWPHRPGRKTR